MEHQVLCYAHRGARGYAPENTLLAFTLAFDLSAEAIECDVQCSGDGQLIIIHDATVDRTTNGSGAVREKSLAELRQLNAGAIQHIPQHIPLLHEVLTLVQKRHRQVNLEIKGESVEEAIAIAETLEPVVEELPEEQRTSVLVSSFEHASLALLKQRLPWLRIAALYGNEWQGMDLIESTLTLGAEAIHPEVNLLTEEIVLQAHEAGLLVNVWMANSWIRIRRLLNWGVDGIFSDYPERVVIVRALLDASRE